MPVGPNVGPDRKFTLEIPPEWQVPYAPGTLRAVAYQGGKQVAVDEVRRPARPRASRLMPDRAGDCRRSARISRSSPCAIEDKDGNSVPWPTTW